MYVKCRTLTCMYVTQMASEVRVITRESQDAEPWLSTGGPTRLGGLILC